MQEIKGEEFLWKKNLYFWGPAVFLMLTLFVLSSFQNLPGPEFIPNLDKLEHLTAYLILSLLFYRAIMGTTKFSEKKCMILAVLFTTLYGLSDELHQSFVPGRDASVLDLISDFSGAVLAHGELFKEVRGVIKHDSKMS